MKPGTFFAATARQIGREFTGRDPGPGLDGAPALPRSPLPLLHADQIDWAMAPTETIPADGGNLRASTIAYRELAQAGCQGLHDLHRQHDRLVLQHHRLRDEVKALRQSHMPETASEPSLSPGDSEARPTTKQTRLPMAGLSGVRGVQGVRGL